MIKYTDIKARILQTKCDPSILRFVPLFMILCHILLIMALGAGYLFVIIMELPWIILYAIAYYAITHTKQWGFWYLVVFLTVNLGRELAVSGAIMDGWRLIAYLIPILFLVCFYQMKDYFGIKKKHATIALLSAICLLGEGIYFGGKIVLHDFDPEVRKWHIVDIVEDGEKDGTVRYWLNNHTFLMNHSTKPSWEKTTSAYDLIAVDMETGKKKAVAADINDHYCSADGKWVIVSRQAPADIGKYVDDYTRINMSNGSNELILRGDRTGVNFRKIMPPSGDKFIYPAQRTNKLFPMKDPIWPAIAWPGTGSYKGAWMPDGKALLFTGEEELGKLPVIRNLDGTVKYTIPGGNESRINPEGTKLYSISGRDELIFYDLENSEKGWQKIDDEVSGYVVGAGDTVFYQRQIKYLEHYFFYFTDLSALARVGLWMYNPAMKAPLRLTTKKDTAMSISPDGNIVAISRSSLNTVMVNEVGSKTLFLKK